MDPMSRFPIRRKKASERIYRLKKELTKEKLSYFDSLFIRRMCAYKFAVPYIKNKIVLDLGCGSGYGTYYLSTKGAKHIIGIDVSKEAIEYCKREYFNDNLQYGIIDVSRLGFKDDSFDVAVSFQVIEHIKNLDEYLSEVRRVTKMFIVSTPNKNTYNGAGRNPFHVREFYLNDLQVLLQSVFQKVNMFGVYSSAKRENLRNKVERIESQINKLRFRSIINLVPAGIKEVLSTYLFQMNIEDFTVQKTSEDCLDFIAVCVK